MMQRPHSARDLSDKWRFFCLKAAGFDGWAVPGSEGDLDDFPVINLVDQPCDYFGSTQAIDDPWMKTALQIRENLDSMTAWIHQKKGEYQSLEMSKEEASLIQSTVASFTATTATEIESLNKCCLSEANRENGRSEKSQHRVGIVQILMTQLKEEIAEPFGRYQKRRDRSAVQLWQTPLQCRLMTEKLKEADSFQQKTEKDRTLELLGLDESEHEVNALDQRFQPSRPTHVLHRNFSQVYNRASKQKPVRPTSLFASKKEKFDEKPSSKQFLHQPPQPERSTYTDENAGAVDYIEPVALQQEALLLEAQTASDLDSVQKVEQMMVDITSLLSQFSNLVTDQQEDVWEIHDATSTTKDNLAKGKDNLVDAKERTASSRHYLAQGIFAMGLLLLIFNALKA